MKTGSKLSADSCGPRPCGFGFPHGFTWSPESEGVAGYQEKVRTGPASGRKEEGVVDGPPDPTRALLK